MFPKGFAGITTALKNGQKIARSSGTAAQI